ncbi:PREDICTED: DNA-binding protein RFX8 isoform X3 [Gavialis gangeticus]|uniref:DNA-binding protein RFX8 isoform X3 n=1 Tax=Gavialis gangeticus TaxID=94835 RepID=UPI00092FD1BE|nr:PREDICTED: DNA-binding protein RFX8 isoform X3 [Gavialis gangeticus]
MAAAAGGRSSEHRCITQWIADHFYMCEGCSVPRCLLYEMYRENCRHYDQNQVNPATFGKLVRLVFPDLGTRRLGTRGSARYHYDGIHIKRSSSFYAHYCYLLNEKKYHSADVSSSEDVAYYQNDDYTKGTPGINLNTEKDKFGTSLTEFRRFSSWEEELGKKHSYEMVALLADEYCSYCQDILQNMRNKELDKVEDCITSFWKSLQPEIIILMSSPDMCQLFKCYDRQLFKTMRIVLNNNSRVSALKSDLNAVLNQEILDIPGNTLQKKFKHVDGMERDLELKCLNNLISLLDTSTDIGVFLNSVSANLRTFVIQPSKSKEEFKQLAAKFQLGWNFLLTAVSKAMTLSHMDSFGSWHLFNLLLLEYVIHILQSHLEEEGDEGLSVIQQNSSSVQVVPKPAHLLDDFSVEQPQVEVPEPAHVTLTQSQSDVNLSSVILKVLSCLVDTATGNKLLQVMLEDKITKSSVKLNLPVGKDALITLKDGQRFIIRTSDPQ